MKNRFLRNRILRSIERGRSMVEIIAVIAIVGILSIGAIGGIRMAINKNTANNLMQDISFVAFVLESDGIVEKENIDDVKPIRPLGIDIKTSYDMAFVRTGQRLFKVMVADVSGPVCKYIINTPPKIVLTKYIEGLEVLSDAQCKSVNQMAFLFEIPLRESSTGEDPGAKPDPSACDSCVGCQSCVDNKCVDSDDNCPSSQMCKAGACVCPPDTPEWDGMTCGCGVNSFVANNKCYSCHSSANVAASPEECYKCPLRFYDVVTGGCEPPCPARQYHNLAGQCLSCSDATASTSTQEECNECPERDYIESASLCALKCEAGEFRNSDHTCRNCATFTSSVTTTEEECNKCEPETRFYASNGKCFSCKEADPGVTTTMTKEQCDRCSNRLFVVNRCAIPCDAPDQIISALSGRCSACAGTNSSIATIKEQCDICSAGTRFWDNFYETCRSCADPASRNSTEEECDRCPDRFFAGTNSCPLCTSTTNMLNTTQKQCNKCPGRYWYNNQCFRMCTSDEFRRLEGPCLPCSEKNPYKTTAQGCTMCGDMRAFDGTWCSLKTSCDISDTFLDYNGYAYCCDYEGNVTSKGIECAKCGDKREYVGGRCYQKGMAP